MAFWVSKAAQSSRDRLVPASSKWIALELLGGLEEVNDEFLVRYFELQSKLDEMKNFVTRARTDCDQLYAELINPINISRSQVLLSPNQTIFNLEDENTHTRLQNHKVIEPNIAQLPSPVTMHGMKAGPIEQSTETDIKIEQLHQLPVESSPKQAKAKSLPASFKSPEKLEYLHTKSSVKPQTSSNNQPMLEIFEELRLQKFHIPNFKSREVFETVKLEVPAVDDDNDNSLMNDSIQAIQIAIRKSIAEKRKSMQSKETIHHDKLNLGTQSDQSPMSNTSSSLSFNQEKVSLIKSRPDNDKSDLSLVLPKKSLPLNSSIPASSNNANSRISSHYKTPKRKSSMFISLPSREPIPISSARTNLNNKPSHTIRSKQPKLTDKLESASQEDAKVAISDTLSPVKLPKSLSSKNFLPSSLSESKLPLLAKNSLSNPTLNSLYKSPELLPTKFKTSNKASNLEESETNNNKLVSLKSDVSSKIDSRNTRKHNTLVTRSRTNLLNSNSSNGTFRPYSNNLSASLKPPRISRSPQRSSPLRVQQKVGDVRDEKFRSRGISPERRLQRSGEPSKPKNQFSPVVILSDMDSSVLNVGRKHDRFMLTTSSSVSKEKIGRTNKPTTKNKFLSTNLNGSSPVKLDGQSSIYGNRIIESPIKNGSYNQNDLQIKRPLHPETIPSLRKSIPSNGLENSKPKKILLTRRHEQNRIKSINIENENENHDNVNKYFKLDDNLIEYRESINIKLAPNKKASTAKRGRAIHTALQSRMELKKNEIPHLAKSSRKVIGNSVPLPEAARGIFTEKRRKLNDESFKSSYTSNSLTTTDVLTNTPNGKSSYDHKFSMKLTVPVNMLPEIHTDEEDNITHEAKKKRTIKSWAATPELIKRVTEQKNINPSEIFGEINVQIDDVFESPTSKERGKQSPAISPINPDKVKEQREYAIKMGYT
jgi:hypothetical protein